MPSLHLHQDKDKKLFISKPLTSLDELKKWNENTATDINNIANIKLQQRQKNVDTKLLVTHDMAGGYKEDNWIQGKNNETIYSLQYWQFVDIFVYFSHYRVTIPPVTWTNACHRNGVLSLGTFLVEGDDGIAELEKLLYGFHDDDDYHQYKKNSRNVDGDDDPMQLWSPFYADKLVAIAKYYGFDGWLFNIESSFYPYPIPPQFKAQQLAEFLDYFKKKLHSEIPGSTLIWYDSLTKEGRVDWQNQLTDKNKLFFEVSDAIFLNYWWKKYYPKKAKKLAEKIGRSGHDIYFGVDVWGRGTFGGGKFNSYKGVQTAKKYGLSSALFGTAWTYEYFGSRDFEKMDKKFWMGDENHPGVANTIRPAPETFWFSTFFDRGFGSAYYFNGKKVLNQPWSHLSHQSIPPSFPNGKIDKHDAYIGGTSIILYNDSKYTALYRLSLEMMDELQLQYIYKPLVNNDDVNIISQLSIEINTNTTSLPLNISLREDSTDNPHISIINSNTATPLDNGWIMKTIQLKKNNSSENLTTIIIKELGFIVANKTNSNAYILEAVRLGSINMIPKNENLLNTATTPNKNNTHTFKWNDVHWGVNNNKNKDVDDDIKIKQTRFWGTLNWHWENVPNFTWNQIYFVKVSIIDDRQQDVFLGTSFSSQFRVSGLDLQRFNSKELLVQPVNFLGQIQNNYTAYIPTDHTL